MIGWITKALTIAPSVWKLVKIVSIIKDIEELIKEAVELINYIKKEAPALTKQVDDVTEKAADICGKLPGLANAERKLRDLIK